MNPLMCKYPGHSIGDPVFAHFETIGKQLVAIQVYVHRPIVSRESESLPPSFSKGLVAGDFRMAFQEDLIVADDDEMSRIAGKPQLSR
jgi:hypothetical protein